LCLPNQKLHDQLLDAIEKEKEKASARNTTRENELSKLKKKLTKAHLLCNTFNGSKSDNNAGATNNSGIFCRASSKYSVPSKDAESGKAICNSNNTNSNLIKMATTP